MDLVYLALAIAIVAAAMARLAAAKRSLTPPPQNSACHSHACCHTCGTTPTRKD